ncbi:terminase small subunit [Paraburkholderia sp. SIMBA_054]|uniref:terminase small subunit n=1 Tax=Paraburkholderia sp. SIMBA_054 TaxID=3085795 RepID=UPI00397C4543
MASTKSPKGLSGKQQRFVDEYLIDLNATQAALRAGYSAKTASAIGAENLRKPQIAAAIAAARAKTANKLEITRERLLAEYARLAFSDPRKFFNADGSLKGVTELDDDTASALAGFEVSVQHTSEVDDEGNVVPAPTLTSKVKWADKKAALDSIARVMGWNQDKVKGEFSGPDGQPIPLNLTVTFVKPPVKPQE